MYLIFVGRYSVLGVSESDWFWKKISVHPYFTDLEKGEKYSFPCPIAVFLG